MRLDKDSIISWAWAAQCNDPVTKFVLVALAKLYDDSHCNAVATSRTLGSMTELGVSTVKKHLKKLEKEGFVTKESCLTLSGATASNKYSFNTHPSLPDDPQCLPDRLPYNNNNNIDTSNLVTIDTSSQLPLLDTSNKLLDRDWLDCLRRDKRWREPATERELEAYIDNCEQSATAMKKEILVEAMDFTDWALARGKSWKTIRGQFPKWIRDELKRPARGNIKQTSTTGSSSHSSDDKYAAAAKRQGGH